MKFALNYSPEAASLIDNGDIHIDLYKCPNWADLIATAQNQCPVYVHFSLMAGRDNKLTLDEVSHWLDQTDTTYVNTHLGPRGADYNIPAGTLEAIHVEAMTERMLADVKLLVNRFGAERVIVENAPMPDPPPFDIPIVPVESMVQIVNETGCGFLLDLAHAVLTCENLGLDVRTYVDSMPVNRLRELHITGIGLNQQGIREDHLPMTEPDWALLDWALDRIRSGAWSTPTVMSFEYGGIGPLFEWRSKSEVIAEQVPRLYELAHSISAVQATSPDKR